MKKRIWILNHYASNMFINKGGRHYSFAENLLNFGYEPTVFCANTRHNSEDFINIEEGNYVTKYSEDIPFNFVKTTPYTDNGINRIKNMASFYKNIFSVANDYKKKSGKPDVIVASSVHPLTLVAGLKLAKRYGVPCICEVRDLWPESIVAYGALKKNSLLAKILYKGEKWIYKRADSIIMTWEGGTDYIKDKKWENEVNLEKVHHISNGVAINTFDKNSEKYQVQDKDLHNKRYKNIVYAGSIRKVNNLGMLLEAAKKIQKQGNDDIRFLIYGEGDEKERLKSKCKEENIGNVIFKGKVDKKYIPYILKNSFSNILHNSSTSLNKYGQSQNKLFEYLAAERSIIQTYPTNYSIIEKFNCGVDVPKQTPEEIARAIIEMCENEDRNLEMGKNARHAANRFDFKALTNKLVDVIEKVDA